MEKNSLSPLGYFICLLGALYYFYETLLEMAPTAMVQPLMASFHSTAVEVGFLDTAYFVTYALLQIPGGALLDRFGAKRLMPIAASFCCLGLFFFAHTHSYTIAIFARLLTGLGGAFGLMGAMYIVSQWVPNRRLTFFLGMTITIGLSGGLLQAPTQWLVSQEGWRYTMNFIATLGAVMAVLMFFIIKDNNPIQDRMPLWRNLWVKLKGAIGQGQIWPIALYGALIYVPTGTLGALWGIEFFKAYYPHYGATHAANINAMIFLGWLLGAPLAGLLADYFQRRRAVIIIGATGALLCLLTMGLTTNIPLGLMYSVVLLLGLFSSCSGITFALACQVSAEGSSGSAIGFTNMMAIIPSIALSPLFGCILDYYWRGAISNGAHVYSLSAYQRAMTLEYFAVALALLLAFFYIKEPSVP